MDFIKISIPSEGELREILIAELSNLPFDTFLETESGVEAYCPQDQFDEQGLVEVLSRYGGTHKKELVPKVNWNQEWEKNFDPITVDDRCLVKATFHQGLPRYPIEIVIEPKMSFGTGHHATTYQMILAQLDIDHQDKSVLDLGTGTGILAILAKKLGAKDVAATDIDDWCIDNSQHNLNLNGFDDVGLSQTTAENFHPEKTFDVVLANINKNVLLSEMTFYKNFCRPNGLLLLSGFYEMDIPELQERCEGLGLQLQSKATREGWAQLTFRNTD